jgi:DNA segregation ATPase FtsK/SpoIIIE-like protein
LANRALFNKTLRKLCGLWAQIHGIYTIVATQRIDKHGFTNAMKQFMPTVVSFQTPTQKDSINILRMPGAEDLADFGEILYSEAGRIPSRIQTPYLDYNNLDKEV